MASPPPDGTAPPPGPKVLKRQTSVRCFCAEWSRYRKETAKLIPGDELGKQKPTRRGQKGLP